MTEHDERQEELQKSLDYGNRLIDKIVADIQTPLGYLRDLMVNMNNIAESYARDVKELKDKYEENKVELEALHQCVKEYDNNIHAITKVQQEIDLLRKNLEENIKSFNKKEVEWESEVQKKKTALETKKNNLENEFAKKNDGLEREKEKLKKEKENLEKEKERAKNDVEAAQSKAQKAEEDKNAFISHNKDKLDKYEDLFNENNKLQDSLSKEQNSVTELENERDTLKKEVEHLKTKNQNLNELLSKVFANGGVDAPNDASAGETSPEPESSTVTNDAPTKDTCDYSHKDDGGMGDNW